MQCFGNQNVSGLRICSTEFTEVMIKNMEILITCSYIFKTVHYRVCKCTVSLHAHMNGENTWGN